MLVSWEIYPRNEGHQFVTNIHINETYCWASMMKNSALNMYGTPNIQHRVAHDDVIKWKHFPRYWPFVQGILRSPVNSPHKGQWRGALMFSSICAWINRWVNNREAGDLRRHRAHYDVTVLCYEIMYMIYSKSNNLINNICKTLTSLTQTVSINVSSVKQVPCEGRGCLMNVFN